MTGLSDNPDRAPKAILFDHTGRRVQQLRPGANDLSRLPAGVYFVRANETDRTHRVLLVR